ncbi:MAG: hypothetical protein Q7U03_08330 [Syntrophales bacterium]|nr:hypothetical protein [Syntrophales bacterium]
MEISDMVAVYGAVLASLVALWDGWKWWCGRAKFVVRLHVPSYKQYEDSGNFLSVGVEILNGNSPNTIRSMVLRHFETRWNWLWKKPNRVVKVNSKDLPKKLEPGDVLHVTLMDGVDLFYQDLLDGLLMIEVYGSAQRRPVSSRLRFNKEESSLQAEGMHR